MFPSGILKGPVLPQRQLSLNKELLEPPYKVSVPPDLGHGRGNLASFLAVSIPTYTQRKFIVHV